MAISPKNRPGIRFKISVFYIITLIPLCLLVLFTFGIVKNIFMVRTVDYARITCDLRDYLESEKAAFSFKAAGNRLIIGYDYKIRGGPYKPKELDFVFNDNPGDYLVYVYGSSPVISHLPFVSTDSLFPNILESKLNSGHNRKIRVYNFGVSSFDSFDIKELVKCTVNYRKPDLIIYYEGHMDYTSAYATVIRRHFYLLKGGFFRKLIGLVSLNRYANWNKSADVGDWVLYSSIEPGLINLMQRLNVIHINPASFSVYNRLILRYYEKNIVEIINFVKSKSIPVIFITPIANLEARPFGIYEITQKYFTLGMKEKDYVKRMEYLSMARDSEIFTGDLRAKSGLNEFLRNLNEEGAHILDLEKILACDKFEFNYDYFYDIGHIKPKLHKIIAGHIYDFIKIGKIIK